ncbi:MAG TPA: hypothetical protein VGL72_12095, partial [Bryobacteraceae bacterium]
PKDATVVLPKAIASELVGAGDVRMIDVQSDPKDKTTGTFLITTTKLTVPSRYDLIITGKVMDEEIVSRPITVQIEEVKTPNAETASAK